MEASAFAGHSTEQIRSNQISPLGVGLMNSQDPQLLFYPQNRSPISCLWVSFKTTTTTKAQVILCFLYANQALLCTLPVD